LGGCSVDDLSTNVDDDRLLAWPSDERAGAFGASGDAWRLRVARDAVWEGGVAGDANDLFALEGVFGTGGGFAARGARVGVLFWTPPFLDNGPLVATGFFALDFVAPNLVAPDLVAVDLVAAGFAVDFAVDGRLRGFAAAAFGAGVRGVRGALEIWLFGFCELVVLLEVRDFLSPRLGVAGDLEEGIVERTV
jgi:hypothetical protein